MISTFPNQEGTSPPEAAIEATPETTPVKDSRHYAPRVPPVNSAVVRALNLGGARPRSSTSSTPSQSQPSSPMKKEVSPFRFPEGQERNVETSLYERRKESIITQKVSGLIQDNLNAAAASANSSNSGSARSPSRVSADTQSFKDGSNGFKYEENSQEDQEVLEISRLGEQLRIDSTTATSASVSYRIMISKNLTFSPSVYISYCNSVPLCYLNVKINKILSKTV